VGDVGCKGFWAFNKRYMNNALRSRLWMGLRVEYRLCLGLDGASGL
jgi:hypothetical protein